MRVVHKLLDRLVEDKNGNILIFGAISLPMLVGAAGLGLDTVQWTLTQRQLQRAADSAAIAGAYTRMKSGDVRAQAMSSLARDAIPFPQTEAVIENAPTSGAYASDTNAVRVILRQQQRLPFSSMFMTQTPIIQAEATAKGLSDGDFCVLALESTAISGIRMQGSATVDLGCGMATNSPAAEAVVASGGSRVNASPIVAVGGISGSTSYAAGTELIPNAIRQSDPFSDLPQPQPEALSCSNELRVQTNQSRTVSANTARCFRGMTLNGTVHFQPGVYVIDGGSFSVGSQAVVTGTNVTFVLTSSTAATNPSSIAKMSISGGATVQLSATTSGTYAGVLFHQDARAPNANGNRVNGLSNSFFQGAFYFPSQGLEFAGTAGMQTDCIQMVARRVIFAGNSTIRNQCPADSGAGAFGGLRVFLVG